MIQDTGKRLQVTCCTLQVNENNLVSYGNALNLHHASGILHRVSQLLTFSNLLQLLQNGKVNSRQGLRKERVWNDSWRGVKYTWSLLSAAGSLRRGDILKYLSFRASTMIFRILRAVPLEGK